MMHSISPRLAGAHPATEQSLSDQSGPSLAYEGIMRTLRGTVEATVKPAPEAAMASAAKDEAPAPVTAPVRTDERLRAIIETAPVGLILASPDGDVLAANQAALALLGAERFSDVRDRPLRAFVVSEHHEALTELLGRVCHGETGAVEYDLAQPGDMRRTVEMRGVPLRRETIGPAVVLGAIWDIRARAGTERDALHARLRESETVRAGLAAQLMAAHAALEEMRREHQTIVAGLLEEARQR